MDVDNCRFAAVLAFQGGLLTAILVFIASWIGLRAALLFTKKIASGTLRREGASAVSSNSTNTHTADASMSSMSIPQFSPKDAWGSAKPMNILVIGKSCSGKTSVLRSVAWYMRSAVESVVSFCPTAAFNQAPALFVPPCFNFDDWNESMFELCASASSALHDDQRPHIKPTLIAMDDCLVIHKLFKSKSFCYALKTVRHKRICTVMTAQTMFDISPSASELFDYVVLTDVPSTRDADVLRSFWASSYSKELFSNILAAWESQRQQGKKESRTCLVLDVRKGLQLKHETPLLRGVHTWEPPNITSPFRCGKDEYYERPAAESIAGRGSGPGSSAFKCRDKVQKDDGVRPYSYLDSTTWIQCTPGLQTQ